MSDVVTSQTRNPRKALAESTLDHENYDYLPVQKDGKDGQSWGLGERLDMESPNHPGEAMYEIVADGQKNYHERALSGSATNVLLRVRKEDKATILKENHDEALRRVRVKTKTPLKDGAGKYYDSEESLQGGVLTG